MLWLAGQIWLWLLISFALGAGITGFLLTRRRRSAPASPEQRPVQARPERTEAPQRISGDIPLPGPAYDRFDARDDDMTQQIHLGRQSGTLPPGGDWHSRNEWPREEDVSTTEIVNDSGHRPRER
jgi:hypothetical protein